MRHGRPVAQGGHQQNSVFATAANQLLHGLKTVKETGGSFSDDGQLLRAVGNDRVPLIVHGRIKMEGKHKRQALGLASRQQVRINEVQPGLGLAAGRHGEHIRPGDAKVHYLNCGALSRGGHQLQVRTSKERCRGHLCQRPNCGG